MRCRLPDLVHRTVGAAVRKRRSTSERALAKEDSKRSIPGAGPLTASAAFAPGEPGRDFAAWPTPGEDSAGGKVRLGHGSARRSVGRSVGETTRDGLVAGACDQASEAGGGWPTARTAWALLTKKEFYQAAAADRGFSGIRRRQRRTSGARTEGE